jgi:hypothetical protein
LVGKLRQSLKIIFNNSYCHWIAKKIIENDKFYSKLF